MKKKPTKSIVKKEPKSNHVIFSYLRTKSKYFLHPKKHEVVIHEKERTEDKQKMLSKETKEIGF